MGARLGPPGTGKSHLAVALGIEAIRAGRGVHFMTLADLVTALARAERDGSLRERIRFLCRPQLLIVDGRAAEWDEVFADPVVATRCWTGSCTTRPWCKIEGQSYRMRRHAGLVPDTVRAGSVPSPSPPPPPAKRRGRPPKDRSADQISD